MKSLRKSSRTRTGGNYRSARNRIYFESRSIENTALEWKYNATLIKRINVYIGVTQYNDSHKSQYKLYFYIRRKMYMHSYKYIENLHNSETNFVINISPVTFINPFCKFIKKDQ